MDTTPSSSDKASVDITAPQRLRVIKRGGDVAVFDGSKISMAITKAFIATEGDNAAASSRIRDFVHKATQSIVDTFLRRMPDGGTLHIEDIQDQVELALMRAGEQKVARAYVLYREEHARARQPQNGDIAKPHPSLNVTQADGTVRPLDLGRVETLVFDACEGLTNVEPQKIVDASLKSLYDGVSIDGVSQALTMTARTLVEKEPNYTYATARLLQDNLRREALSFLDIADEATYQEMADLYAPAFKAYIAKGIAFDQLDPQLAEFDLERLGAALDHTRDAQFTYLGLQTLYDRYFLHHDDIRYELPQVMFMRVAMGLALNEDDRETRAIEFYELLSNFDYMASTPTLFNAGTVKSQLSSCYLTTVPDQLDGIYGAIRDNAMLSKWAGGLGNDWTPVRALGSYIKGTNGKSQGVVPFLKVVMAVNQCFAPDTQVHTADGVKAIKDITRDDLVLGQRGEYRQVTNKFAYNQRDPMVELNIKHTVETTRVTAGHPLWALRGVPMAQAGHRTRDWLAKAKIKPEWVDAGELTAGDYVAQVIPREVVPVPEFSEDDARLYGILLGDGHLSKDGQQWGVSGNPSADADHLRFVCDYLEARGIHHWQSERGTAYRQIHWAAGRGVQRCATTGQITGAGEPTLPFVADDLYDAAHNKRIHRRFAHLPKSQTLALIQGLLETDGGVSRGKEIYFTNTSRSLAEGLRYQCLRLGVPTAGQYREREQNHEGRRSDGSSVQFTGTVKAYDIRVPAVPEIAERVNCVALTKRNWIEHHGCVFTRVRNVCEIDPISFVYDLKVEGDPSYMTTAALAHNGGKRKGAVCAYLETWHLDVEEFLELRKNTGDDRRRTHDMNTANWVPDLFMKRVCDDEEWTLFSPSTCPDLHDLYGAAFETRYAEYEEMTLTGQLKLFKRVKAKDLWRKMLSMLFETGHPWITFKDPSNLRSPQNHAGVVHSSNLCTEITLNTSADEIAVCNLGSINLAQHIVDGELDGDKLRKTVKTAVRMLDNVIDINYYAVPQAKNSNFKHRPVGLGLMGFQDALYKRGIAYASQEAVEFSDTSMELISYHAIEASSDLAAERGRYQSFEGSLWSKGVLPIDSIANLAEERGADYIEVDTSTTQDWTRLRDKVVSQGMRNSNVMAIAPTATISNICGVTQSIEPTYQNLFVKSNLSGEFTVVNAYMVNDLKERGLWDEVMINDLKYYDGSVQPIDRVPDDLKARYASAFEVEPKWLVEAAARRQKWIDQAQSLNLYIAGVSGKKLDVIYRMAWFRGLKTTYYLRALGATSVERSTVDRGNLNAVGNADSGAAPSPQPAANPAPSPAASGASGETRGKEKHFFETRVPGYQVGGALSWD
ncbi:ribonucleoside-diphosphate reductase subunit alpha [Chromohalobacter sp. 296-RDG]|uniref:ribonucleoside-diphosphate reductase subunit alpha n=1 Tax=Chromohalobacter sp. 296-RDG TaxID=2994062 RepID=UPI0024684E21|nr:ribonucleoside-diphosphate reductase subunit alpha [Chromohalobacter sp. 296-RDG]